MWLRGVAFLCHRMQACKRRQLVQTLKRNASLSYVLGKQSTRAFAKHIGCFKLIRSSDMELFGLPGRTRACVPIK